MVVVADIIWRLTENTIENILAGQDSILHYNNVFIRSETAIRERRLQKLIEKVEKIGYEISEYILNRWKPIANII